MAKGLYGAIREGVETLKSGSRGVLVVSFRSGRERASAQGLMLCLDTGVRTVDATAQLGGGIGRGRVVADGCCGGYLSFRTAMRKGEKQTQKGPRMPMSKIGDAEMEWGGQAQRV